MLDTCKDNSWKLQFLQRSGNLNGKLHWIRSFSWDNFGLPIPNSNLGRASWAPRSGLFGGSAAVAWRHHVTWHRWVMVEGFSCPCMNWHHPFVILILFRFHWWRVNNRQYRFEWIFRSSSPKGHCWFAQCFGASPLLPEQSRRLRAGWCRWCRVSVVVLCPPSSKASCIPMYHSFIVQIWSGIRWGHPKRFFAQGFVLVSWKSRLVIYWYSTYCQKGWVVWTAPGSIWWSQPTYCNMSMIVYGL